MTRFLIAFSLLALAACTSGPQGIRVVNGGTSAIPQKAGAPIANLNASQISAAITGKTFQYTRPDGTGFVSYSGDGTFQYQDDKAGAGNGRWNVNGDQYCESYGGKPMECGVFKNTGDAYFAANSRLVEMKV
ncbi:MAG: hypothetical protein U1E15_12175 [Hyphomicrobiales bacterium]